MTGPSDIDRLLSAWMEDGPTSGPRDLLSGALASARSTRQRPAWLVRRPDVPVPARMLATTVAATLVVALAFVQVRPSSNGVGGPPSGRGQIASSSPSPTAVSSPTSSPDFTCLDGSPGCLGPLAVGAHSAPLFGIGFTVPVGWVNLVDTSGWFLLAPQDETSRQPTAGKWLAVFPDAVISAQPPSCAPSPLPGVNHTVDAIVTYLTHHQGLVTSNVTSATIGGLSGKSLDLSVAPSWTKSCPGSKVPEVSYLTENHTDRYQWAVGSPEHQRLIVLDDGSGGAIVVAINSPTVAGFDALVQAATPIINSFSFHRGAASSSSPPSPSP